MDVLKKGNRGRPSRRSNTGPRRMCIGPLEAEAMEILWDLGEGSVQDVLARLSQRGIAYTTVMTTLARLFMKGVLTRRKLDRKFLYRPRFTAEEWHKQVAMEAALCFLSTPDTSHELLMSCLKKAIALQSVAGLPAADSENRDEALREVSDLGVKRGPQSHPYLSHHVHSWSGPKPEFNAISARLNAATGKSRGGIGRKSGQRPVSKRRSSAN